MGAWTSGMVQVPAVNIARAAAKATDLLVDLIERGLSTERTRLPIVTVSFRPLRSVALSRVPVVVIVDDLSDPNDGQAGEGKA
jgi:hypothetical protein